VFGKYRIVNRFRRRNRRSKRVYGERIEDIVLRLACIRELRNQAECNLFLCNACDASRTGLEKPDEIMRAMENIRRAQCICEFLHIKESQERKRLRLAAPIFTVYFEQDWERYMTEYNVVYDEESEVYYPIPRFLDVREDELQIKLGEFEDVTSAAMALFKKWPEKVRFRVFDRSEE